MPESQTKSLEKIYVDEDGKLIAIVLDNGDAPAGGILIEERPTDGKDTYDFSSKTWIPYQPKYDEKRKSEYLQKLGDQGDQNDAIYKGVMAVVDLLKTLGVSDSQLNNAGLLPDKNATPGTPAYWLGTIEGIKTKNPKPNKE